MRKILFFFVALFLLSNVGWTQSITNYTFSSNTSSTLEDLSTGATSLMTGNNDDVATAVAPIGFAFYYGGVKYSHFSANSNGQIQLHTSSGATAIGGSNITSYTASTPILFPMAGDNEVNNGIKYKVIGTAPNRKLVVEWSQFYVQYTDITNAGNMQVWLEEGTGIVSYVYGEIYNSSSSSVTRGIALSFGNTATTAGYVTVGATPTFTASSTLSTNTFAAGSGTTTGSPLIANLGSSISNGRTAYVFTPTTAIVAPTNLTFSSIGISGMTLNWDAASPTTNVLNYAIYNSTDNVNFNFVGNVAVGTNTYTASGLSGGTTYYWRAYSVSEGAYSTPLTGSQATLPCSSFSGTMTVGPTGNFPNLTTAIANLGACDYTGNIILELQSTYVSTGETFPLNFTTLLPSSAAKTITIRPETGAIGLSITSANTTGTILLSGASYITFDGRPGGVGTSELTIANTNLGNSYAVKFVNDANNNAFNYCKINSVNNSTSGGTIIFGNTTGANGNDNNTISNCNIFDGATTPYNAIYGSGSTTTTATYNSNNTISNCNIYNYYASGSVSSGIYLTSGNTDWTISNNNFYQTSTRVGNASSNYGIYINNSGNNFSITGNNIGGSAASCGGTAWTYSLSGATRFVGIYLNIGTTTASSVQNNTISNLSLSSSSGATTMPGVFGGIYLASGNANIGTVTGNTIGNVTGTGSISVTISTTGGINMGIGSASTGTVSISNNTIGSINVMGTGVLSASFNGIWSNAGATALVINNNTIGSTTTANSINYSNAGTGTTAAVIQGIVNSGAATAISITNNTIANLNSAYVPTAAKNANIVCGISSTSGTNTITGNAVYNLSTAANATGTTSAASVIGISMTSSTAPAIVSQNTIYGLSSNHATAAVCVTGLHYSGPSTGTNVVARNLVYGFNIVSSSATSDMRGINFSSGLAKVQNNVIRLGYDASGTALISGIQITGLFDAGSTANTGMYFNSVYVGGTSVNTVAGNTYAFKSSVTTNARIYQNNIFFNGRSNATTGGKHYAMLVSGTGVNPTGLTLNYNDYIANGTGAVLGYYGADVADLATWKTNVGQDLNSISADPLFVAPTAVIPNLNLTTSTPCEGTGFDIPSITDDYTGALRSGLTPVDMGAYAGLFAPAGVDMKPTAITAPIASGCFTAAETVTVKIMNAAGSIIDFSVNPVTVTVTGANAAAAYNSNTTINTGTLAIGGTLDVNMPATIDMTANGTYSFNATTTVTGDINTANDVLATVNRNVSSMGGTYTVGTAGTYATLTAAVAAYNSATCITGPVIFSLTDASYSTSETFPIVINANAFSSATNTLTIKPATGVTTTITSSTATNILNLNGADFVTIDGSNNGTNTKDLTITNTNASGTSVILISSLGNNAGATNNTIKNCNIQAGAITSGVYGISIGTTAGSSGADNDNNTIQNNTISKAYVGIYASGSATANPGLMDNLQVIGNSIGSTTATDYISHDGIKLANTTGSNVSQNTVYNLIIASSTPAGISLGSGVVSTTLTRNNINNVTATGTSGYGGRGIFISTGNATSNLTISNNLVYAIGGDGYTGFSNSSPVGIYIDGTTGGLNIYNNSVNMNSATLTYSGVTLTAALLLNTSTITAIDLRNNIFVNTMNNTGSTTAKNYAIYSSAANTAFTNINNNDYFVSGTQGVLGYLGSDQATLATLVTSFGQNANSISADPVFVSVPVQLTPTSPALNNTGVTIATVPVDYTGASRSATPDMGAVEFTPPTCYAPTALTATSITATGATLGWTTGGIETAWNVEYGITGFTQGTGTVVPVSTTPTLALTTLTQNTVYQFYVQANCGVPGTSTWAGPFSFTTPYSCPRPTLPTVANITSSSADLGWTAGGTETAWILYYKKVADADYTEVLNVTTNPYNISGLDPSTNYIFKVKANCSVSDTSITSVTKTFTTPCGAVSTLPWFEGFETGYTDATAVAGCWSQVSTTGTEVWNANSTETTYNRTPRTGTFNATLHYSNEDWLFYPFSLTGGQSYTFEMYARQDYASTTYANITVSYGSNGDVASMTNPIIATTGITNGSYQKLTGAFTPATSGIYYLGIKGYMNSTPYYISIDDIKLDYTPVCLPPTALNTTALTAHDAILGWTPAGTETAWNVEYGAPGFTPGIGAGTVVAATTNSATISDLTQNTGYSFYVQADCGIANGQSSWAGPFNFTTPYSCPKPTVPTVTNVTSSSADLGWTAGGTETAWIVYYKEATATNYTEVTGVTTNPYTLNGLTPATNYIFKVKANCSASDTSFTSDTKTFTTACLTVTAFPYTESFSSLFPACWTASEGSTGASYHWEPVTADASHGVTGPQNGTNFMKLNVYNAEESYNPYYLATPVFSLGATPKQVQYYYFIGSDGYTTTPVPLTIQITTDNGTTWTDLFAHTSANSTLASTSALTGWHKQTITLNAYANQTVAFRFVSNSNYGSGTCNQGIDEFVVEDIPTCPEPTALTATSITTNSAVLGWTAGGTETAWTVYYKASNATSYTQISGITSNPYTLTGLNSGTTYSFKVKANCSATDTSFSTAPFIFSTACGVVTSIDENFDGVTATALPNCWSKYTSPSYTYQTVNTYTTSPYNAPNCVQLYSSGATVSTDAPMLISPAISNLNAGNRQLRFYAKGESTNTSVIVGTMTDPLNSSTFTPLETVTGLSTSGWNEYTVSFATYSGTDQYIAIQHPLTTTYSYVYVDNVVWEPIPTCLKPTALAANSITTTGAILSWTAGATETAWNVQYGLAGFSLGTGTTGSATTNSFTLATLNPSSTYEFYVQSICSASDLSTWAGPYSFSTLCGSVDIPYTQNFDGVTAPTLPNCITVTNDNSDAVAWVTASSSANSSPNAMRIGYNSSASMDDWFYTPGLNLTAGKTYNLKFYYRNSGSSFPEKLEVKYGTDANATAMTSAQVFNNSNIINSTYQEGDGSFTVATSGVYYVGFHGYSDADMYYILVDDISITTPNTEAEILTYTIPSQVSSTVNTGTTTNGTVDVVMPYGTDVTALTPTITVSTAAIINPASGVQQNFTTDVPYVVTAEDLTTTKNWTVHVTVETQTCTTPSSLGSYGVLQTTANIHWTSAAPNFNVEYRVNGGTAWTSTTSTNDTLLLSGLTAGMLYDFRVQAICSATAGDTSNWSTISNFTTLAVCSTPTALTATSIAQISATLGWTSTAANFNVRYRTVGSTTWTSTTATTNTLPVSGLTPNTQYEFQVQATCSATPGDTSDWASVVTFTTLATPPCGTPTALAATSITQTTATLGWTSTAANFNVRYRTIGSSTWTSTTASATSLPVASLTANTQYEFQVQAVCSAIAGDTSAWATAVTFTTLATPPCGTPTALAATSITQTTATLGWTSTATNFNVRYRTVGSSTWTNTTASAITLPVTGLTANTQYEFQVQAVCSATAGDTSAWATAVTFTTLAVVTCPEPTALVVSAISEVGATLNWTAGGTETAWNLRYKKVADATYTNVANTSTKPYILSALQPSTAYVWNVQAVCSGTLTSIWSADNTFTTTVGIESNSLSALKVYSYENQVNVINNGNLLVKEVVIYDVLGQEVDKFAINSTDNILINTNLTIGNYVVKVITAQQVGTYKLFIK